MIVQNQMYCVVLKSLSTKCKGCLSILLTMLLTMLLTNLEDEQPLVMREDITRFYK